MREIIKRLTHKGWKPRNRFCNKIWYYYEMFRLRKHRWTCDCGGKAKIVGYSVQITYFKCLKCKREFEVEGY